MEHTFLNGHQSGDVNSTSREEGFRRVKIRLSEAVKSFTRRILLNLAFKNLFSKYSTLWRYFEKTGGFMKTNGVGSNNKISFVTLPGGLVEYAFMDAVKEAEEREPALSAAEARWSGVEGK